MTRRSGVGPAVVLEVHREPGPPRLTVVVRDGQRVADLEVGADHRGGSLVHADGWCWQVAHPPGSGEWWLSNGDGAVVATATRHAPVGERFEVELADGTRYLVTPVGRWWTRRWRVRDEGDRAVLEVNQRRVTRPVHDVVQRAGDLPGELVWVVAWLLAERLSRGQARTRRPRWGISTDWGGEPR